MTARLEITEQGLLRMDGLPFEHDDRFIPAMLYLCIAMTVAVLWLPVYWLMQKKWMAKAFDLLLIFY